MLLSIGNVYKNDEGEFLTPAQNGNFFICDMWVCDKEGNVQDIEENPYPVPKYTNDLTLIKESNPKYEYPEFSHKF